MVAGVTWVLEQNDDPSSPLYRRIDTAHVGATGHSQGGFATTTAAGDGHVTTMAPLCGASQQRNLHGPAFFFCGGQDTTVPCDGIQRTFEGVTGQPAMLASCLTADHANWITFRGSTLSPVEPAVTAWMRVQLMNDTALRSWFYGADCKALHRRGVAGLANGHGVTPSRSVKTPGSSRRSTSLRGSFRIGNLARCARGENRPIGLRAGGPWLARHEEAAARFRSARREDETGEVRAAGAHLDAVAVGADGRQRRSPSGEARGRLAVHAQCAPGLKFPANDVRRDGGRLVVADLVAARRAAERFDAKAVGPGVHVRRAIADAVARGGQALPRGAKLTCRARVVALAAVIRIGVEIDAARAAQGQSRRAAALAAVADLVVRAGLAARAAVVLVRVGVDAHAAAFVEVRRTGALTSVADLVVHAGDGARPAVSGVAIEVRAMAVAVFETLGTDALAVGAGAALARRIARAAVLGARIEVRAFVSALVLAGGANALAHLAGCGLGTGRFAVSAVFGVAIEIHASVFA
jgi:hypothetical protein